MQKSRGEQKQDFDILGQRKAAGIEQMEREMEDMRKRS